MNRSLGSVFQAAAPKPAGVVHHEVQVSLPLLRIPADEPVPWLRLPGRGAEAEQRHDLTPSCGEVPKLRTGQR